MSVVTSAAEAAHPGPDRLSRRYVAGASMASFGLFVALLTPLNITMALKVQQVDPDGKAASLSLVLGVAAFIGILVSPVAGRLSDRTGSRYGMRRPWLLGGMLTGTAGTYLVVLSDSIPRLLGAWCVAQVGYNVVLAALAATLPDQVPPERRGALAGVFSLTQNASYIVGTFLPVVFAGIALQFMVPALLGLVSVLVLVVLLRDRTLPSAGPKPRRRTTGLLWFDRRRHPDMGWAVCTRFLFCLSQAITLTYLPYLFTDHFGVAEAEVPWHVFLANLVFSLAAMAAALVCGVWSDRLGRRKVFVFGSAVLASLGLLVIVLAPTPEWSLLGQGLCGLGSGCFYAVDLALIVQVLPSSDDVGKDLGVANVAAVLPQSVAPVFAPMLIAFGGYPLLFLAGALAGIVGALLVRRVRAAR
ncbi:MFS transporter [Rhizohabitans arisaemae]|uniref:MFS transporter n=1 Tax=Rhizohabitans arisaemae TaxID=2720610 RepID=UPI0024B1670F|nr:MFS transporter [Rhizohabitans arisaemae]